MPFSPQTTEIRLNNLEGQKTITKAQHTPGPWYLSDTGNLYSEATDQHIANLDTSIDFCNDSATLEANSRLIAAAPELLEALKSFVEWTEIHKLNCAMLINGKFAEVPVVINARKAIAKATGE